MYGHVIDRKLIDKLFSKDELMRWFGTDDPRDDDGTGEVGTLISPETGEEILRRVWGGRQHGG